MLHGTFIRKRKQVCMHIQTSIVRKLDDKHVQIDASAKNIATRHFKVENNYADSFFFFYPQFDKKAGRKSDLIFFTTFATSFLAASIFTKKLANQALKILTNFAAAGTIGIGSYYLTSKNELKNHDKFLSQHHAQQIYFK